MSYVASTLSLSHDSSCREYSEQAFYRQVSPPDGGPAFTPMPEARDPRPEGWVRNGWGQPWLGKPVVVTFAGSLAGAAAMRLRAGLGKPSLKAVEHDLQPK